MELDKEEWEYIRNLIDEKVKLENKIEMIKKACDKLKETGINKNTAVAFITAIKFIVGEQL